MKNIRTCVTPEGRFVYGIHKPSYKVRNIRHDQKIEHLGSIIDGTEITNTANFPKDDIHVNSANWIFEIPNPLSFRGTTFIEKEWADNSARNYNRIKLPRHDEVSFSQILQENNIDQNFFEKLPDPILLSLATCSTDSHDLVRLAELSCSVEKDKVGNPIGLHYDCNKETIKPIIKNYSLFKAVSNNPNLPDEYKNIMVLRPGAQGKSEIVGEWQNNDKTHVFEYLRRNSYISGGHYAANMSDDAVRYSIENLSLTDITGLRHLYYQRTYLRLAEELSISIDIANRALSQRELETIRQTIVSKLEHHEKSIGSTLWGWNFGFDYAPSKYRLHASHQQIHQQYAMIPNEVEAFSGKLLFSCGSIPAFSCGDMVGEFVRHYREVYMSCFFNDYIESIINNERMDERNDLESGLIVWKDANAMLFVPKAQTSQWELQLVTLESDHNGQAAGNIVEADSSTRDSLDNGILTAQKVYAALGAKMVTTIEYPKKIGKKGEEGQRLLYSFLPKLPHSPGAFSEAQLRYINGHYPEDFAAVCRKQNNT